MSMDESEPQHSQQICQLEEERESIEEWQCQINNSNFTTDYEIQCDENQLNDKSNQDKSLTTHKRYIRVDNNRNCQCAIISANENVESVPKRVLLRHRLGYSMMELDEEQRASYTLTTLENYLLYKEHKYNAVNTLGRFDVFTLLIMTFAVFCEIFSMSSSAWVEIRYYNYYESIGVFVSCTGTTMHSCTRHANKLHSRSIFSIDGNDMPICNNTLSFVTRYVIIIYIFGIVELIFEIIALFGCIHIALRPTRSRAIMIVIYALLANVVCHVIICALFATFTRCARQTCTARNEVEPMCVSEFDWGYKVYISAAALNMLSCLIMTCMHSFLFNLHWHSWSQLCQARHRRECKEMEMHCANEVRNTYEEWEQEEQKHNTYSKSTSMQSMINANEELNNSHSIISEAHNGENSKGIVENELISRKDGNINKVSTSPREHKHDDIACNTVITNDKSCVKRNDNVGKTRIKRTSSKEQRRGNIFARLLTRDFDPNYLTAKELGVSIPHASDWVYDDRSDMFYSFSINYFYDPLSGEYYNVALKTWQDKVYETKEHSAVHSEIKFNLQNNNISNNSNI